MNAIEIRGLKKSFRGLHAVDGLNMTVPVGAIYGFIGENGSGKSTTEKLICGHLVPSGGKIKLFGKSYRDAGVRIRVGALIENTGCFPNSSVYQNLKMQCINLGIADPDTEIDRVLKIVRMEDSRNLRFKKCSLGMDTGFIAELFNAGLDYLAFGIDTILMYRKCKEIMDSLSGI